MRIMSLFASVLLLLLTACVKELAADETRTQSTIRAQLLESDFSAQLAAADYSTFAAESESSFAEALTAGLKRRIGKEIPDRGFTEGELQRLGVCADSDVADTYLPTLIRHCFDYYWEHGELPPSGADLCENLVSNLGVAAFEKLAPERQFLSCIRGVNPITGRFYTTFSNPEWHPGGVYIQLITGEELETKHPNLKVFAPESDPRDEEYINGVAVAEFVVFGEEPGTELYRGNELF